MEHRGDRQAGKCILRFMSLSGKSRNVHIPPAQLAGILANFTPQLAWTPRNQMFRIRSTAGMRIHTRCEKLCSVTLSSRPLGCGILAPAALPGKGLTLYILSWEDGRTCKACINCQGDRCALASTQLETVSQTQNEEQQKRRPIRWCSRAARPTM